MKAIFLLILGGVLVNNYAFERFLGVSPMLGYSRKADRRPDASSDDINKKTNL